MIKLQKILWADDGSNAAEKALDISEYLARLYDSEILGVYVNYVFYPITPDYIYYKKLIDETASKYKKRFQKRFSKISGRVSRKNIKFKNKIIRGEVVETVNKAASENKADLIAIGNTGQGFISRLLIGSNAIKILKSSTLPVLSVPESFETKKYRLKKILVPIDVFDMNLNSLNYAIEFALMTNSSITILYVLPISTGVMEYPPRVKDQIFVGIENELNKLIKKAKENVENHNSGMKHRIKKSNSLGIAIRKKYIAGMKPSRNITDYAARNNFDMIIMNSHNKGKIKELVLGSVTEEVFRTTRTPVISIRT
jgi:nucleotide-binding universal stress UspA family protein